MGCISCGGGGTKPRTVQTSDKLVITPMKEFIESEGWKFTGNCGCRNNLNIYITENPKWQGYEIWLNLTATRLEVRRKFGRETKVIGIGYVNNFSSVYYNNLP